MERDTATRYYISSKNSTAQFFQKAIRSHWSIENRLHWMLDVAFHEDNSKKPVGNSARNFLLFSKIALNMIQHHKLDDNRGARKISVKRKRKMAVWNNNYLPGILLSFESS